MKPKKSLGQNFLMHQRTAERIVDAAKLSLKDTVLEVGPGTGMLTRALLQKVKKVIAVEADGALVATLQNMFEEEIRSKKLVLIHEDVRSYDVSKIGPYRVVANIPYYITGELIRMFLSTKNKPRSMTLLVQKEVAERIARTKKESLLSLSVKVYGTPRYIFTVPRGAFFPAPTVDSAVLSIEDIQKNSFVSQKEEGWFFTVLKAGFQHKRKLLAKNLSVISEPARIKDAFLAVGIQLRARAEDVPLSLFKALVKNLRA